MIATSSVEARRLVRADGRTSTERALHPWWRSTLPIRAVCVDLADHAYIAVAPDLYDGELATAPDQDGDSGLPYAGRG